MQALALPDNDWLRQMSVNELEIADTQPEEQFDRVVRLAARLAGTRHAALSVLDGDRVVLKSAFGAYLRALDRADALCTLAIEQRQTLIVGDALQDERFRDHPLVRQPPGLRFYAGAPIRSPAGVHVATLCVFDEQPRPFGHEALREGMQDLAQTVESELLLRSFKLRDPVTGLYNQQTFQLLAERAWRRARNARLNASIVTVSLERPPQPRPWPAHDNDALMRLASQRIQACCADTRHLLARDRSERFALLVLNETQDVVRKLAEAIGTSLGETIPQAAPTTISIGVAHSRPLPMGDKSLIDLLERAQSARLRSREGGSGSVYIA
jgi:GGDEF domain-containing protein